MPPKFAAFGADARAAMAEAEADVASEKKAAAAAEGKYTRFEKYLVKKSDLHRADYSSGLVAAVAYEKGKPIDHYYENPSLKRYWLYFGERRPRRTERQRKEYDAQLQALAALGNLAHGNDSSAELRRRMPSLLTILDVPRRVVFPCGEGKNPVEFFVFENAASDRRRPAEPPEEDMSENDLRRTFQELIDALCFLHLAIPGKAYPVGRLESCLRFRSAAPASSPHIRISAPTPHVIVNDGGPYCIGPAMCPESIELLFAALDEPPGAVFRGLGEGSDYAELHVPACSWDIYEAGVLLLEWLAGAPPCDRMSRCNFSHLIKKEGFCNLFHDGTETPQSLRELILSCLNERPEARPSLADIVHHEWFLTEEYAQSHGNVFAWHPYFSLARERKWKTRKAVLLIRTKSKGRRGEAFAVWNVMTTVAQFLC